MSPDPRRCARPTGSHRPHSLGDGARKMIGRRRARVGSSRAPSHKPARCQAPRRPAAAVLSSAKCRRPGRGGWRTRATRAAPPTTTCPCIGSKPVSLEASKCFAVCPRSGPPLRRTVWPERPRVLGLVCIVPHKGAVCRRQPGFSPGNCGPVQSAAPTLESPVGLSARQSGVIAVTSVSTIISGKASEATPIRVWTGSGAVPKFLPRHWP